ncbi:MAG: hypothetical protein H7256_09185 [Bdellovibrio sp.]|nr:hypothetical protein [Bdellovibrio sp.]
MEQYASVTLGVQMHEIGHAIYEIILNEFSPHLRDALQKLSQRIDLTQKGSDLGLKSYHIIKTQLTPEQMDQYSDLWSKADAAGSEYNEVKREILKLKSQE